MQTVEQDSGESRHRGAPGRLTVLAFGDLMLPAGEDRAGLPVTPATAVSSAERADIVFANLESTLAGSEGCIVKEPLIVTGEATLRSALASFDLDVVSLSNNHAFDCYESGFAAVRKVLTDCDVKSFGAGTSLEEALVPCVIERNGVTTGWLGFTALDTEPSHVAGAPGFGVCPLDPKLAVEAIRSLRAHVDHVIVSVHWGVEYCHIPAPEQRSLAGRLLDAGASVLLGHHVHVVQGLEWDERGVVAYGLGNATTLDLNVGSRLAIKQSARTRSGMALRVVLDRNYVRTVESVPFRTSGDRLLAHDRFATWLLERANRRLAAGVTPQRWRRARVVEDVVLRPLWKLDPRVIRSVRLHHVRKLVAGLRAGISQEPRK